MVFAFWFLSGLLAMSVFMFAVWYDGDDTNVSDLFWLVLGIAAGPVAILFVGYVLLSVWYDRLKKNKTVFIKGRGK